MIKSICCLVMKHLYLTGDSQRPVTIAARDAILLLDSVGTYIHMNADTQMHVYTNMQKNLKK